MKVSTEAISQGEVNNLTDELLKSFTTISLDDDKSAKIWHSKNTGRVMKQTRHLPCVDRFSPIIHTCI